MKLLIESFVIYMMLALISSAYAVDIPFMLNKSGNVSLAIYDAKGRMICACSRAEFLSRDHAGATERQNVNV